MDTEQRIKQATKKLIFGKGKFDFRLSEISKEANVSHSILHYYFRSRKQLLMDIEDEMIAEFLSDAKNWLIGDLPLKEKVEQYISSSFHRLSLYPFTDLYLINRFNNEAEMFAEDLRSIAAKLLSEIGQAMSLKIIKKYQDPILFIINMISLTSYPFIVAEVLYKSSIVEKSELNFLLEEQKKIIIKNLFD